VTVAAIRELVKLARYAGFVSQLTIRAVDEETRTYLMERRSCEKKLPCIAAAIP
jgi:hypothetical protein